MEAGGGCPSLLCLGGINFCTAFIVLRWRMSLAVVTGHGAEISARIERSFSSTLKAVCCRCRVSTVSAFFPCSVVARLLFLCISFLVLLLVHTILGPYYLSWRLSMFPFPTEAGGVIYSMSEIGAQNIRTAYCGGSSLHESFWQIPQRVKLGAAEWCMWFVVRFVPFDGF
ncbi:hypothetical protein PIB30_089381 [Stylosanthes scabra]|uniref:Uncharacterized protein n=1 Tax=Stylosanthes scabra TaxID=79078 RepID=A0ABU6VXL2_9FABA|nr:hypothetical protein [Stylosanthes scabra]